MKDDDLFRQYARDALRASSKATSEREKQALMGPARTWMLAALVSERVLTAQPEVAPTGEYNFRP
jgi:hypothetical protein